MNVATTELQELSEHRVLSPAQCAVIRARVLSRRAAWTKRGEGFFTFGTASYMDAAERHADYLASARRTNPILREAFADLHERVSGALERILGRDVVISPDLAVPGFHVYEFDGRSREFDRPATRAHFDLQWMSALLQREVAQTLSFTLLIEQPTGGAALEVWPLRFPEPEIPDGPGDEYAQTHPSRRVAYTLGAMVVHDGHVLHAIGKSTSPNPEGRRITLQGHGALVDGTWVLYW